ncbi:MAG TPA: FAD-binding oxidoreductase [Thermoanaerobaculia bacterium]|jgi:decaprenylphospho-beta-D-ribofuranose 2-oxidase|nr:FAD-binding oxidoreductase [Thermoanaerobaculia bacterium]
MAADDAFPLPRQQAELCSFDGGVEERAWLVRPDRYRDLEQLPDGMRRIVRGGGYSYAAASFGGGALVQDFRAFDRVLGFDAESGRVRCEAGITLGKLFAFAAARGLYLPVQPGHPDITVGGCIAADVHGKSPALDGTFRRWVVELTLFHPARGLQTASAEENAELFELTCGGYGLTGHIVAATLQLRPLPIEWELENVAALSLLATVDLLVERGAGAGLAYTWNDLCASGAAFGRGFLHLGRAVNGDAARADGAPPRYQRLPPCARSPLRAWRRPVTPLFNRAYGGLQRLGRHRQAKPFALLFPIASRAAYFRLFGGRGLHEYQVLVPRPAFAAFARGLQEAVQRLRVAPTLGSCKLFTATGGHLRFAGDGICMAVDFPRSATSVAFAARLDDLTAEVGGIPNVIKDSRLPRAVVERCYPRLDDFRRGLLRLDADRLYRSELAERLAL